MRHEVALDARDRRLGGARTGGELTLREAVTEARLAKELSGPIRSDIAGLWTNRCEVGTDTSHLLWFHRAMEHDAPPTARQLYALAAALCEQAGEAFPGTRGEASSLIERLRLELGHPEPRLDERRPRRRPGRAPADRPSGTTKLAQAVAAAVVRELGEST